MRGRSCSCETRSIGEKTVLVYFRINIIYSLLEGPSFETKAFRAPVRNCYRPSRLAIKIRINKNKVCNKSFNKFHLRILISCVDGRVLVMVDRE